MFYTIQQNGRLRFSVSCSTKSSSKFGLIWICSEKFWVFHFPNIWAGAFPVESDMRQSFLFLRLSGNFLVLLHGNIHNIWAASHVDFGAAYMNTLLNSTTNTFQPIAFGVPFLHSQTQSSIYFCTSLSPCSVQKRAVIKRNKTGKESHVNVCIVELTLNRVSSSLGLFCHVSLKRTQLLLDWRMRSDDSPNAMGCIYV